ACTSSEWRSTCSSRAANDSSIEGDSHPSAWWLGIASPMRGDATGSTLRERKRHREFGAGLAVAHADRAPHPACQLLDGLESDAGSGRFARQFVLRAVEQFEDSREVFGIDAGAVVAHVEAHRITVEHVADLDDLVRGAGRELHRIVDEIDDDLHETIGL